MSRKKIGMTKPTGACNGSGMKVMSMIALTGVFVVLGGISFLMPGGGFGSWGGASNIRAATWNMAAINNNPFEYWITAEDASYNALMKDVSTFIRTPGAADVPVHEVFTQEMFDELISEMRKAGWADLDKVQDQWLTNYKDRKVVTEFIKDDLIGKKRLASMPDRITNTINTANGKVALRPTVINCYDGDLSTQSGWWKRWMLFMFQRQISVKDGAGVRETFVRDMLPVIRHAKYPAISEEEEAISVPLETMSIAIFDAILVNMLNSLSTSWQGLRNDMCNKLNRHKVDRSVEILTSSYWDNDVLFLQEVASVFVSHAEKSALMSSHSIHTPALMDDDRDQNSIILLKRGVFTAAREVTDDVIAEYASWSSGGRLPLENGDLFVLSVTRISDGTKFLLASFHGDTNGLATIPVVKAVQHYLVSAAPDHKMLFGMDANTYANPSPDQQGVLMFARFYKTLKLNSCYGPNPNPLNFTTFHARTFLQTQLNKAITLEEKDTKGDKNPKDFIVFFDSDFKVLSTTKDNTGDKKYIEGMVFPTLKFPSDHGITSTVLEEL